MSEGIEAATNAFAADLKVEAPAPRNNRASETAPKPEPVFGNSRKMEGSEEEDSAPKKEKNKAPKPEKRAKEPESEEEEPSDHGEETDDGEGGDQEPEELETGADEGDGGDEEETAVPRDEEDDEDDEQEEVARKGYDPKARVKVKVDGKEEEVSLQDAVDGYIRTKTFHTRMQSLTDTAKAVRARAEEVNNLHDKYSGLCDALEQELNNLVPKEPDWGQVFAELPKEQANAQYQAFQKLKADREAISAQRVQLTQENDGRKAAIRQQDIQRATAQMLEDHPEWADPVNGQATWSRDRANMQSYAKHVGITDEEFNNLIDPRFVRILNMAARYHRLQTRKPVSQDRQTKPSRPGAGTSQAARKGKQNTAAKLARSGRTQDAAEHFKVILAQER